MSFVSKDLLYLLILYKKLLISFSHLIEEDDSTAPSEKMHFGTASSAENFRKVYANSAKGKKSWGLIPAVSFT